MKQIKTENQIAIEKISAGLKDLSLSVFLMTIALGVLFYIIYNNDLDTRKGEYLLLYSLVPFGATLILSIISIYKIGKTLQKNVDVWFLASIIFPIVIFIAILYFFIIAVFQIIKLKLSKDAEQGSAKRQPGQVRF